MNPAKVLIQPGLHAYDLQGPRSQAGAAPSSTNTLPAHPCQTHPSPFIPHPSLP